MKKDDTVVITKKAFLKEHNRLIKLLDKPKKQGLAKEAKAQKAEIKAMMGMRNY